MAAPDPIDLLYDVIIIGGGPAGLSAALYSARAGLKTLVADKNPDAGSLAQASKVENYPGISGSISGAELLQIFRSHAESFGVTIMTAQVIGVNLDREPREVITSAGDYYGKSLIIATGNMGRKPSIEGEERFIGRGVSYCASCDAPFFKGMNVAVLGKVPMVLHEAEQIAKFASKVFILTPQNDIPDDLREYLRSQDGIELLLQTKATEINGDENGVKAVRYNGPEGDETLEVRGVFAFLHGNQPVVDFLYGALETTDHGCIKVDMTDMSTSAPGVFAAGDVICKKVRQVVTATSEGATAAISAEAWLNSRKRPMMQWG